MQQFLLSTSSMLAIARYHSARGNMVLMDRFLFFLDIVGDEETVRFYEQGRSAQANEYNKAYVATASIIRQEKGGRIEKLSVPGCGTFVFTYNGNFNYAGSTFKNGNLKS